METPSNAGGKAKVAAVQIAPVMMDREATVQKVCDYVEKAAAQGAQLILFPEALIPGYPWRLYFGTTVGHRDPVGRKSWYRYWASAVDVPGAVTERIGRAAKKAGVYVALGLIERDQTYSHGTLYCTLVYFGPDGRLLGKHRKLKPTAAERYIWGEGDGSTMPTFSTEIGRIGGLICWENYMPLARMAMYAKGLDIYLAPTADSRDTWQATIRHIACEGRCFVVSCCQFVTKDMYPKDLEVLSELADAPEVISRGGSAIVSPMGEYLAGPLFGEEGIVFAELDLSLIAQGRYDFDVVGHYARPDVFRLIVDERPKPPVEFVGVLDGL
ncbi:MAG: carbon-nitrogen hydrolase family protein [Bacillota bacterium]